MKLYFSYFLKSPDSTLEADGSNFIKWYKRFRNILIHNNILYVLEEALGERPDDSASEEEEDEFHSRRDIFIEVEITMTVCLTPELKELFRHKEPYVMIDAIKTHVKDELRHEQFRQLREFRTIHMEEHTCLKTHLKRLYDIYFKLTNVFDYRMANSYAIQTVLISLPPSYEKHVHEYVLKADNMNFYKFVSEFKSLEVDSIEGEIFDATCIYLIYRIMSVLVSCYVIKYLIFVLFMKQVLIITYMWRIMT